MAYSGLFMIDRLRNRLGGQWGDYEVSRLVQRAAATLERVSELWWTNWALQVGAR